ncbi:MAG TPA: gluconeogenesis factor YvcK family protein [Patescibacteria group bacterium]|nr:gluconeogenesis factor YvcK family protein [Patescibacteria group bacterium]
MRKITVIGGGTGTYTLLKGLKYYDVDLTAIVTTADSGGSSGQLRDEFGVLPPGDLRRCLVALSEKRGDVWRQIFEYRFNGEQEKNNLGNLIITALVKLTGDLPRAIDVVSDLLEVNGRVLPATLDNVHLCAKLEDGQIVVGESNIDIPKHNSKLKIREVYLEPQAHAYKDATKAIMNSDLVIMGPGDLYTSIIPNLLVEGIPQALKATSAKVYYVCNVMTKHGETSGFTAKDFILEIQKYSGHVLDGVICNSKEPSPELAEIYSQEQSYFVRPNVQGDSKKVIKEDLIEENPEAYEKGKKRPLIRHDSKKLAKIIVTI